MPAAPIKISPETDQLLTEAAHYLGRTKKDVVDIAVREFVENHRAELVVAVRSSLARLDGTIPSLVSEITGFKRADLDDLGGFEQQDVR